MTTGTEAQSKTGAFTRTGTVVAVCYSETLVNHVGKRQHKEARITTLGIKGDKHYGETRYSSSKKATVPNNRPITVVGAEATREACAELGIAAVPPGGLGENVLTEGAGNLGELGPGDEIRFYSPGTAEPTVVLLIGGQNEPCANLRIYHTKMVKALYGKRGVLCTVLKEGTIRVGDKVETIHKA